MAIAIKMPALSPTMEQGTLAKWLVKVGDSVASGDIMAEIETDKATMEFEAVDEGVIASIDVPEGSENVAVGTVIATLRADGTDDARGDASAPPAAKPDPAPTSRPQLAAAAPTLAPAAKVPPAGRSGARIIASPLAKRIAGQRGVDLAGITGSGPGGRIVRADVEAAPSGGATPAPAPSAPSAPTPGAPAALADFGIPHEDVALSGMRKTIARRLTESKQQVPHIYLTLDIRLDTLLTLRAELNAALAARKVKLSVNDMLIKALAVALIEVPACNVAFAGDTLRQYTRADISVAVSIPGGLITPIITDAAAKGVAAISTEMHALGARAKEGKLQPHEYQGGTASLSNMGMLGIKQFEAVINPPQAMILAVGAGERRPWVLEDDTLGVATVMSATGSFDHRAIDGADGARLMSTLRELVEKPLALVA